MLQQDGFRLSYVEIYNWGTFDEQIWKLQPNGKNSLLTGANGSGNDFGGRHFDLACATQ